MRCSHCGDVIGSYEPLIVLLDDEVRETSRAAEPELALDTGAERFHVACFSTSSGGAEGNHRS